MILFKKITKRLKISKEKSANFVQKIVKQNSEIKQKT